MVDRLMAAAGSTRVIDVELTRSEVRLSVVSGQTAQTYAWRDNQISQIDSDITYVGQTIFDPRSCALNDLGSLFSQAAAIAGSSANQQLQIVDYDNGNIYMNVTTNPETLPVFFTTTGVLVRPLNPANLADLAQELAQVVSPHEDVVRLGISDNGSVYADLAAGTDQVMRVVRASRFPVRDQLRSDSTHVLAFDSDLVTADDIEAILTRASAHLDKPLSGGFSLTIERSPNQPAPLASVTIAGKTSRLTLEAVVLN